MRKAIIKGIGAYLPKHSLTNDGLSQQLDTSDAWIMARTGIKQRHIAAKDELTSDLGTKAAQAALEYAGYDIAAIDLIIAATTTPDRTFPSTAAYIQAKLGSAHGAAFDMQAVCSGYVYALATASAMLESGQAQNALIIGCETMSRIVDWEDRATAVLFGDGAAAMILAAEDITDISQPHMIAHHLRCDGNLADLLYVDGGVSSTARAGYIRMQGQEIFRRAVTHISSSITQLLHQSNNTIDDIDWFVPHQANFRIIDAVARKIGLPEEKTIITVQDHANTSAASIPLALEHAVKSGRIKPGDLIMTEALGGGLTWGANLFRW